MFIHSSTLLILCHSNWYSPVILNSIMKLVLVCILCIYPLGAHLTSWISRLIYFIKFGQFQPLYLFQFYSLAPFLLKYWWYKPLLFIIVLQLPKMCGVFFQPIFLCVQTYKFNLSILKITDFIFCNIIGSIQSFFIWVTVFFELYNFHLDLYNLIFFADIFYFLICFKKIHNCPLNHFYDYWFKVLNR